MAGVFTLDVQLSPALQDALRDHTALIGQPVHQYLERAAESIKREAQRQAESAGVGDHLAHAHEIEIDASPLPTWATVENTLPYAPFVHGVPDDNFRWGRRPGRKPPPSDALEAWAQAQGIPTDHATLFLLARAIGEHGIPARPWLKRAAQHEEHTLRGVLLAQLAADVAARWQGKAA